MTADTVRPPAAASVPPAGRRRHASVVLTGALIGDTPSKPFGGGEEIAFSPDGRTLYFTLREAGRIEATSTNLDIFAVPSDGSAADYVSRDYLGGFGRGIGRIEEELDRLLETETERLERVARYEPILLKAVNEVKRLSGVADLGVAQVAQVLGLRTSAER